MKDNKSYLKNGVENIFVTILLSESTTSFLNLNLPHVEHMHPDNSKIFIISPEHYKHTNNRIGEEGLEFLLFYNF